MKVSESGYTKDELLDIVDKYLAEEFYRGKGRRHVCVR